MNSSLPSRNANAGRHPSVTVSEITDPTAADENIEIIDQDVVLLRSTSLRAKRVIVRLIGSLVVYQSTNLPIRSRSRINKELLGFVVFGPQAKGTFNSLEVGSELLVAAAPGIAGEFVVQAGYESISIFLSPLELERHFQIRQRADEFRLPNGVEILQTDACKARALFEWGKSVVTTAEQQPELFDEDRTTRAVAHSELLETLLSAFGSATDYKPTRKERTRQSHSRIIQIAEDLATNNTADRVCVTDLCEAAGVSERTLQYAFKEVLGVTPLDYLTRLRLHRVRKALRRASNGETNVSAEALRWGFWHFGEFSRSYKNCFGELPSDTLKRTGT